MSKRPARKTGPLGGDASDPEGLPYYTDPPRPVSYTKLSTTSPSSSNAGAVPRSWLLWAVLIVLGAGVLLLGTVVILQIILLAKGSGVASSLGAFSTLLGQHHLASIGSEGSGLSEATITALIQSSIVMNPVPSVQYLTLQETDPPVRMAYRSRGNCASNSSDVVLFVHGLGSSSGEWISQMNAFAIRYCCIAVDLLGHGHSDTPETLSGGSLTAQANYLQRFLQSSSLLGGNAMMTRNIAGVGNGFGSSVLIQLSALYPAQFAKFLIVNPFPILIVPGALLNQTNVTNEANPDQDLVCGERGAMQTSNLALAIANLIATNHSGYMYWVSRWSLMGDSCAAGNQVDAIQDALFRLLIGSDPQTVVDGWLSWIHVDHRNAYQTLPIPVGFVVGSNFYGVGYDAVRLAEHARDLVGQGSSLFIMAGTGRVPHLTHVHAFNEFMEHFLDSTDTTCGSIHADWIQL